MHPFAGSRPHSFLVDITTHGGSSGSPVFSPEDGRVLGVVKGSPIGTPNLTYVVPSRFLLAVLAGDLQKAGVEPYDASIMHYDDRIADARKYVRENEVAAKQKFKKADRGEKEGN